MLYKSLVLPIFEYCDFIFDCLNQQDATLLECLQNASFRNISGFYRMTTGTAMRTELNQDSLSLRREHHTLNEMYKIVHKMSPDKICSLFSFSFNDIRTLGSETRQDLNVPRCKLECGKSNFVYRGSIKWNRLPIGLRNANSLKAFKKTALEHLRSLQK